ATKQLEHFQNKIYQTIASGLRSHQAAAIAAPLACQNRREVIGELLVSTKHETDFALANTNISGRNIPLRTNVLVQLLHERLTEAHHLAITLAMRIKIGATLPTTHRYQVNRILQRLLKRHELEYALIDGRMKTQAALVRPNGAIHLHAVTAIDTHHTLVIHPRYAELDNAFRFHQALQQCLLAVTWVRFNKRP